MAKSQKITPAQLKTMTAGKQKSRYLEHKSQVAFFQEVDLKTSKYPHWKTIHAIPNAARRSPQQGKRLKDEGMRAGTLDINAPFARGGYCGLWIEMKVKGNYPSQAQKDMIELLRKNGNRVVVCYSSEEAFEVLEEYEHS